jgi:hypothetical protein
MRPEAAARAPAADHRKPVTDAEQVARDMHSETGELPTVAQLQERVAGRRSRLVEILGALRDEFAQREQLRRGAFAMPGHVADAAADLARTIWLETTRIHLEVLGEVESRAHREVARLERNRDRVRADLDKVGEKADRLREQCAAQATELRESKEIRIRLEAEVAALRSIMQDRLRGDAGEDETARP